MNFFRSKSGETEPLEKYINQAWSRGQSIRPFGQGSASATTPPVATLRKGCKNRIIYYIGSFNPPHVGHLALIDHVFSNTKASSSSSSSAADDDDLNAVALIVIPHAEYWIERKARRAAMEAQAAKYPRGRGRGKSGRGRSSRTGRGSSTNHDHDGDEEQQKELHLPLEQRLELVRDGVSDDLVRAGVWLFPADLGAWWEVHPKLLRACADDGFDVEYVELLGPDYVRRERPQRSGMHGVVTSNVCRGADFVVKDDDAESPEGEAGEKEIGEDLLTLNGFTGWDLVRGPGGLSSLGHEAATQQDQGQDGQKAAVDDTSKVFVCRSGVNLEYRIWFVQCDQPQLDPGISSTALRRMIKEVDVENLEDAVRDIAMSPAKLVQFVRDMKKQTRQK